MGPAHLIGTVKFFRQDKGWGFLVLDDGRELFVHASQIVGGADEPLREGQRVTCVPDKGQRGPIARLGTRI